MLAGDRLERLLLRAIGFQHDTAELFPLLRRCSDEELFSIAIENSTLWDASSVLLAERTEIAIYRWDPKLTLSEFTDRDLKLVGLLGLPAELVLVILEMLDLKGLRAMAGTCKHFYGLCNAVLDEAMTSAFNPYGLSWHAVRFALTITGGVISGYFAFCLAFVDNALGLNDSWNWPWFHPAAIRNSSAQVLETIAMQRRRLDGTVACIDVHRCADTPLTAVFWQPLTCYHTWMSGAGIFIAYPDHTFARRTMGAHAIEPPGSANADAALYGLDVISYHADGLASCGSSATCPSVIRNSADSMCFRMAFSTPGCVRDGTTWWCRHVVQWTLGSDGCTKSTPWVSFNVKTM
ncbi:hypothetical protein K438DRAFT_2006473 [Mycena galopus ATCC 62051]|nr:hypothetical protein K438DRAFT_2006473 [Mycena galopus ATCC 62051]